jgi:hypothetical protein
MEKIIRTTKDGTVQMTIADERFYIDEDGIFLPSSSWISSYYPKGIEFYKYLAGKGWDKAEEIKLAAGEKGTKVHMACEDLLRGTPVPITGKFLSNRTGQPEELTPDECTCIYSFQKFLEQMNPKIHLIETNVKNKEVGYAGTMDLVCEINGELGILDIKTAQYIWTSSIIQCSSYKHAFKGLATMEKHGDKELKVMRQPTKLWILQPGYKRNKDGWKLTEIEDDWAGFLLAKEIWQREAGKVEPKKLEFPEVFTWNGYQDNAGRAENTHRKVRPRKEVAPEEDEEV